MKLELKKFDITKIQDDKVIVMIGKRGTGKS
jgi:ABC-type polar amino acid transport system ATPase subunit